MLRGFLEVAVAGEKQGIITVPSQNPITIQLNHVVLGAPRGRYSYVDVEKAMAALSTGNLGNAELAEILKCPKLTHHEERADKLGWCREISRWTDVPACLGCVRRKKRGVYT